MRAFAWVCLCARMYIYCWYPVAARTHPNWQIQTDQLYVPVHTLLPDDLFENNHHNVCAVKQKWNEKRVT